MKNILNILCCLLWIHSIRANDSTSLLKQLKKHFPALRIEALAPQQPFQHVWKLWVRQPLDHRDSSAGSYYQQVILYHRGFKKPNVLVTEGYDIQNRIYEPTMILDANQFSVEYRFFGSSVPDRIPWNLLTQAQALADHHFIQEQLKKIYKKSWLVTGISKGGTTAALYSLTYPESVRATMAYVAPFPMAQEDPRTIHHYREVVGTPECRAKVKQFQRTLLHYREALKPKLLELAIQEQVHFSMDLDQVIDYAAVEYPFSFWQWGFGCKTIPGKNATVEEVFEHMEEVVDFNYYDDKSCAELLPAYYQFMTEYGYYGFDTSGLSDLLLTSKLSNLYFCPKEADLTYRGTYMKTMREKAMTESKHIIYIYGGVDTWTACAVELAAQTESLKLVRYNGGHRTRLRDFPENEKELAYQKLKKWMKTKVEPLPY